MDKDQVIDLLHAIMQQYDGNTVELDGESFFIEEVCEFAIQHLENEKWVSVLKGTYAE